MYLGANPYEHTAWQIKLKGVEKVNAVVLRSNGYKKRDDKMEVIVWRAALKDLLTTRKKRDRLP